MEELAQKVNGKANLLNRFIAKLIDLLIVGAFLKLLPPIGFLAGLTYLLIGDGLYDGRSLGKKFIGLRVILTGKDRGCSFRESIIRNLPFGIGYILFSIPWIGWIFPLIIFSFEGLLIIGSEAGARIGDEMAKTQVVDDRKE
ncbi:MAG: hypothetical protein AABY44_07845 [Nitrospirota bacterium]